MLAFVQKQNQSTTITDVTGSAKAMNLTQTEINGLQIAPYTYGCGDSMRYVELYVDLMYAERPTVTLITPTGTVGTSFVRTSWTYTQGSDDARGPVSGEDFTAATIAAGGFDPDLDRVVGLGEHGVVGDQPDHRRADHRRHRPRLLHQGRPDGQWGVALVGVDVGHVHSRRHPADADIGGGDGIDGVDQCDRHPFRCRGGMDDGAGATLDRLRHHLGIRPRGVRGDSVGDHVHDRGLRGADGNQLSVPGAGHQHHRHGRARRRHG